MEIIEILHFSNFSSIGEMVRLHGESILGNPSNKERDRKSHPYRARFSRQL